MLEEKLIPCVVYRNRLGRVMYVDKVTWVIWEKAHGLDGMTFLAHVLTPQEAIRFCTLAENTGD